MKYESDLKHTTTSKARAEDKQKKARGELRVTKNELRAVRDELQVARDELCIKATILSRVTQEDSKAVRSMERLTEGCHGLRGDLQRQEALVSQKDRVIVELRDEVCTLWAFGWLSFRHKAAKVFLGLDFNFQVPVEGEAEKSDFDDGADPVVFSDAPGSVPLPSELEFEDPVEAGSPTSVVGTSPSDLHGMEVWVIEVAQSPASDI